MSIVNVSKSQNAETLKIDLPVIGSHISVCLETDKKIRSIERKQLAVFGSAESAEAFCKELRVITKEKLSIRELALAVGCTKHRSQVYCQLAKVLKGTCNGKTSELVKLCEAFLKDDPERLTFFTFVAWISGGNKKNGPKPDRVSANIGGLVFTLKEGEAKPPKEYKASDLERAIKLLDTLSNKLKALR